MQLQNHFLEMGHSNPFMRQVKHGIITETFPINLSQILSIIIITKSCMYHRHKLVGLDLKLPSLSSKTKRLPLLLVAIALTLLITQLINTSCFTSKDKRIFLLNHIHNNLIVRAHKHCQHYLYKQDKVRGRI